MSKFSYSNVRLGQNHGGERDNRREKQTIKKGNPSIRPLVRLLLLPEMMMGEVRGHTYMTSALGGKRGSPKSRRKEQNQLIYST